MDQIREKLRGVFAPLVTPFKKDKIFYNGLVKNVEKMNRNGLRLRVPSCRDEG